MSQPWGDQPGYVGAFSRDSAPGAIPNGTRIVKVNSEPGDSTVDGTLGTVLGSFGTGQAVEILGRKITYGYFIEWDDKPQVAIGTVDFKVQIYVEGTTH